MSHSEIAGSKLAHSSPTLIAACHVLHRLCMPRHPPNALTSRLRVHTTNDNAVPSRAAVAGTLRVSVMRSTSQRRPGDADQKSQPSFASATDPIRMEPTAVTASISRTHSQCQRGAKPHNRGRNRGTGIPASWNDVRNQKICPLRRSATRCANSTSIWWSLSGSNR